MLSTVRFNAEELKTMPMQRRLLVNIVTYQSELDFYSQAAEILRKRNYRKFEWDVNDRLKIREYNRNIEECVSTLSLLKDLYMSEYDDYSLLETIIKESAQSLTDHKLKKFGWVA